jgi:hypothetical protein
VVLSHHLLTRPNRRSFEAEVLDTFWATDVRFEHDINVDVCYDVFPDVLLDDAGVLYDETSFTLQLCKH